LRKQKQSKPEGFKLEHTKSSPDKKHEQIQLDLGLSKEIELGFDGGSVCTDGGLLLLRKADNRLGLAEDVALAMKDLRRPDLVKHSLVALIRQLVFAIAAGYEDCNDATKLRDDAMHKLAVGYEPQSPRSLASQPTLSRFENRQVDSVVNAALQRLLVHLYIRHQKKRPKVVRLAMDTTCDEVHGYQQLSFFNGYYGTYCYAPLFVFTDCGFPLASLLRPGHENPVSDAIRMLRYIIGELRRAWPGVKIELTADAGFNGQIMFNFCESSGITYFIGAAMHSGFAYHTEALVRQCKAEFDSFGYTSPEIKIYGALVNPKDRKRAWRQREERIRFSSKDEGRIQEHSEDGLFIRRYGEFRYEAREWDRERRVIFRVHYTNEGPDVRCVVTNQEAGSPRKIYDEKYCRRSQCENWIKDLKTYLKCDRTSCQEFEANQFRLLLHTFAYILIWEVRKRARLREMTVETFRLQFIKIGVLVVEKARRISLKLSSHFPWQEQYLAAWRFP